MALRTTHGNSVRRLATGASLAVLITVGLACGGDNETDTPTTTTTVPVTETTVLVKNMPRNNCVSVMSGERPPPGVTIPRCQPTGTIAPRPPSK